MWNESKFVKLFQTFQKVLIKCDNNDKLFQKSDGDNNDDADEMVLLWVLGYLKSRIKYVWKKTIVQFSKFK